MRKSVIVEIPNTYAKKPTIHELIILALSEPKSAPQVTRELGVSYYTIAANLSNMAKEGKIKVNVCPHCEVGRVYKR